MARRRYRCSWDDIAWLTPTTWPDGALSTAGGVKQLTSMTMVCRSLPSRWKMTGTPSRYSISGSKPAKRTTATQSDRGYFRPATLPFRGTPCILHLPFVWPARPSPSGFSRGFALWALRPRDLEEPTEQPLQRLIRRANKIALKLDCDNWMEQPIARPPHMRLDTFERLKSERAPLVAQINQRIGIRLAQSCRGDWCHRSVGKAWRLVKSSRRAAASTRRSSPKACASSAKVATRCNCSPAQSVGECGLMDVRLISDMRT